MSHCHITLLYDLVMKHHNALVHGNRLKGMETTLALNYLALDGLKLNLLDAFTQMQKVAIRTVCRNVTAPSVKADKTSLLLHTELLGAYQETSHLLLAICFCP